MAAFALRTDYDAAGLRGMAKVSKSACATRRLLTLAEIYDGGSRTDAAARIGGGGLQTVRDWCCASTREVPMLSSMARRLERCLKLDDEHRRALLAMIEAAPIPAIQDVVRWRLIDLAHCAYDEYRISVTKQILSRELRALGYRKLSARPRHHAKNEAAAELFERASPPSWPPSRRRSEASR